MGESELYTAVDEVLSELLAKADRGGDPHYRETVLRAHEYAKRRIEDGRARTPREAKLTMAAFADGFRTGIHEGSGCEEN